MTHIELSEKEFSLRDSMTYLKADTVGAIVFFVGTVRDSPGHELITMEIEAYEGMYRSSLEDICTRIRDHFPIHDIYIHHRTGSLQVQDSILLIGVSASHRKEAYDANKAILEEIKLRVPIWKKEIFSDGEAWVEGVHADSSQENI